MNTVDATNKIETKPLLCLYVSYILTSNMSETHTSLTLALALPVSVELSPVVRKFFLS